MLIVNVNVPAAPLTAFSERVSYDANGNITTYNRKAGGTNIEMDNLTYGYHSNTNKLRIVNDAVAATNYTEDIDNQVGTSIPNPALPGQNYAANYQYDASGNLISDQSQGSAITWNTYGKVKQVVRTGTTASTLAFGYDAMQQRIVKTFTANNNTTKTYYIRDAQGNVMATYDLSNNQLILKEMNLYGSSRLGTLNPFFQTYPAPSGGMANSLGNRQYELTNHLGNVMATVRDTRTGVDTDANGTANYFTANVASAQEYYPFGMTMPGRVVAGAVGYKYGFNGKEQDRTEWGGPVYDYGFRIYDARVQRFLSVDPLAEKYAAWSPYNYVLGNPIGFTDPTGMSPEGPGDPPNGTNPPEVVITGDKPGPRAPRQNDTPQPSCTVCDKPVFKSVPTSTTSAEYSLPEISVSGSRTYFQSTLDKFADRGDFYSGSASIIPGSFRTSTTKLGFSPKYYGNSWTGNQYAKTFNIGKLGKMAGSGFFVLGTANDMLGVHLYRQNPSEENVNAVSPLKASVNFGMGLYGIFVNPAPALIYSGFEAFYPGGTSAALGEFSGGVQENRKINPKYHPVYPR